MILLGLGHRDWLVAPHGERSRITRLLFRGPHLIHGRFVPEHLKGLCRKFSLEAICGMVSPGNSPFKEKESDDGGELQGGPFPQGYYPDGCALVCSVSLELSAYRRIDGRARRRGRSLHDPALGRQIQSALGRGVPSVQTAGV